MNKQLTLLIAIILMCLNQYSLTMEFRSNSQSYKYQYDYSTPYAHDDLDDNSKSYSPNNPAHQQVNPFPMIIPSFNLTNTIAELIQENCAQTKKSACRDTTYSLISYLLADRCKQAETQINKSIKSNKYTGLHKSLLRTFAFIFRTAHIGGKICAYSAIASIPLRYILYNFVNPEVIVLGDSIS